MIDQNQLQTIGEENIKKAIGEFLVYCPVYRYYGNSLPLSEEEAKEAEAILNQVKEDIPPLNTAVDLLSTIFFCITQIKKAGRSIKEHYTSTSDACSFQGL